MKKKAVKKTLKGKAKRAKKRTTMRAARRVPVRSKKKPGRSEKMELDGLVVGLKELERERDQLRRALEKIRDAIDAVV